MSESARQYYQNRGVQIVSSVPSVLDGAPIPIIYDNEVPEPNLLAIRFHDYVEPVEPFILAGVRYVDGKKVSDEEWEVIKNLPPFVNSSSAVSHAQLRMARHLLQPDSTVFLEAIAVSEVPRRPFIRATMNKPVVRESGQEVASVAFLARAITASGQLAAAYLTVLWGEHKIVNGLHRTDAYLTPRYFGAPVTDREMKTLPRLFI